MSQSSGLRPDCKNNRCRKRTILSVYTSHPFDGRFYWRCPTHGWSEWATENERMQSQQHGEIMEAKLLCEFIPSMQAQSVGASGHAVQKPTANCYRLVPR